MPCEQIEQDKITQLVKKFSTIPDLFESIYDILEKGSRYLAARDVGYIPEEDSRNFPIYYLALIRTPTLTHLCDTLCDALKSISKMNSMDQIKQLLAIAVAIDRSCQGLSLNGVFYRRQDNLQEWRSNYERYGRFNSSDESGLVLPKGVESQRGQRLSANFKNLARIRISDAISVISIRKERGYVDFESAAAPIKVAFVPLIKSRREMQFSVIEVEGRKYYRVAPAESCKEELVDRVVGYIEELQNKNVDIVIFPELVFCHEMLEATRAALRNSDLQSIKLCFCGSYIEDREEGFQSLPSNSCVVLDYDGKLLFTQRKMHRYRMTGPEQKKCGVDDILGGDADGLEEGCSVYPRELYFLDTRVGRFCVLICEDFARGYPADPLISDLGISHLVVPVMDGPGDWNWTLRHGIRRKEEPGSVSMVVNSPVCMGWPGCSTRTATVTHPKTRYRNAELETNLTNKPYAIIDLPSIF